jgi:hypothetical protein
MWKPFNLSFAVPVLLAFACYGQTRPADGGQLHADWTQMPIQDNSEVLDIVLNPANGVDWIVGINVRDGENAISVGDGSRGNLFQMATGERTGQRKSSLMPPIKCNSRDLPSRFREERAVTPSLSISKSRTLAR